MQLTLDNGMKRSYNQNWNWYFYSVGLIYWAIIRLQCLASTSWPDRSGIWLCFYRHFIAAKKGWRERLAKQHQELSIISKMWGGDLQTPARRRRAVGPPAGRRHVEGSPFIGDYMPLAKWSTCMRRTESVPLVISVISANSGKCRVKSRYSAVNQCKLAEKLAENYPDCEQRLGITWSEWSRGPQPIDALCPGPAVKPRAESAGMRPAPPGTRPRFYLSRDKVGSYNWVVGIGGEFAALWLKGRA